MDPAETGSFIRELIDGGRRDVAEVADQARQREKRAQQRERRARWAVVIGVVAAVLISIGAGIVAVDSSDTRAEDVAARVAPDVFRQLVAQSRAQRIANARGVLTAANGVLADRGLPMVADPGPQANPEQILAAASSAQVLSVLPEDIVQQLRDQLDGRPIVLPSAAADDDLEPGAATSPPGAAAPGSPTPTGPSGGQPSVPGNPGGTGAGPGPSPPGGSAGPGGATQAPPPPTRRRLIPQIVPLPIPLIGT